MASDANDNHDENAIEYRLHRQTFLSFSRGLFTVAGALPLLLLILALSFGGDPYVPS